MLPPLPRIPKVGDVRYSPAGRRYTVSLIEGKTFAVSAIAFARFDLRTGKCDRYPWLVLAPVPPAQPCTDVEVLCHDVQAVLRQDNRWAVRMLGGRSYTYGHTIAEAVLKGHSDEN